ncbi:TIGR01777 family oxidoreductase [Lacinutrix undariae]
MKILITGATGLVGKEIVAQCHEKNIDVHYLTTSKNKLENKPHYKGFYWNPKSQIIDVSCFVGIDCIINLAGTSISKRWSTTYKAQILQSRVEALQFLQTTIAKENITGVKHMVSASAIGVYPDSITNYYDETSVQVSNSFLGEVVQQWESAADAFTTLGIKVSKVRIGLVLAANGGALSEMVKPIKYGLGSAFGSGKQWQSWIHVIDLARLFVFILEENIEGVINGVAPNPVTNTELTKAVAKQLKRPLFLPNIPKVFMKLLLGDMHILLFESQRVSATKIEDLGFNYNYYYIKRALEDLL